MSASIKVTHIIIGLGQGGAESMLRRLIEASLKSNSLIVHNVISLTELGFHGHALINQGVSVDFIGIRSPLDLPRKFFKIVNLLRKTKPNVVQTWMVHADLIGGVAAHLAGVSHVIWGIRTTDYSVESRSTRALRWFCARLSELIPSKIVSAAQASLKSSISAGYSAKKSMVIPNGFNVEELRASYGKGSAIREQIGVKSNELLIGCLGRYNPAKDHLNFVRAAALVASKYNNCRFLMVGSDLTYSNKELMSHIEVSGFADRFALLGERSDPAACIDAMDVFVLSSCTEGFPNVLGEAMAMSIPCVSTDVGDAAILLGDVGKLVPPRSSTALAAAIESFIVISPADRDFWGERGLERLERNFSIKTASCRFNDLYSTLSKAS